jgi:AmmeMemoRadiSam system protein A
MSARLTSEQGKTLVALARATLKHRLCGGEKPQIPEDPALMAQAATFVTLNMAGHLRGCIGNLQPVGATWQGICDNALNAALHDPRFSPLRPEEVERIDLHISILSPPQPLVYASAEELLTKLRPGVDGVILREGRRSATFLPQVWEQLPDAEQFLNHLCRKAGLPEGFWRKGTIEVLVYEVQGFHEESS